MLSTVASALPLLATKSKCYNFQGGGSRSGMPRHFKFSNDGWLIYTIKIIMAAEEDYGDCRL